MARSALQSDQIPSSSSSIDCHDAPSEGASDARVQEDGIDTPRALTPSSLDAGRDGLGISLLRPPRRFLAHFSAIAFRLARPASKSWPTILSTSRNTCTILAM